MYDCGTISLWWSLVSAVKESQLRKIICIVVLALVTAGAASGANYCVRSGAPLGGTGSDWQTALIALPGTLVRGATYYVADGTYPGCVIDDAVVGSTYITIKKATLADHGTDIGWAPEYGDGVATFTSYIAFSTSYIVFDGVTGGGPPAWKTGHGFEVTQSPIGAPALLFFDNQPSHIRIHHVNAHFTDRNTFNAIIYGNGTAGTYTDDVSVSHCYLHEVFGAHFLIRHWQNLLVEYTYIARNKSTPALHAEGVSSWGGGHFIFRHNIWQDIWGTGGIVNLNLETSDWQVYGNVFFESGTDPGAGLGHGCVASNISGGISPMNNIKVYNNTAVNISGLNSSFGRFGDGGSNNEVYNNIYYKCANVSYNNCTHGYDLRIQTDLSWDTSASPTDEVTTTSPFVDVVSSDFHLSGPTVAGKGDLGSPYNIDMDGRTRGGDGNWDRGAYEAGSGGTIPGAPYGLRIK
jgi:hypothetical protein